MRQATVKQATAHSLGTSTAGTTSTRTRKRNDELVAQRVRRTRRFYVDLDYVREVLKGMGCTAAYIEYVMQHGGLPEEDKANWPRQYKTLQEVLAIPANNITHIAPALEMEMEAFERLAQAVYAEEAPAATPGGHTAA